MFIKGIKTWESHKPEQCWHTDKQSSLCDPTHSLRYNCSCLHDQSTTELINYFQFSVYNRGGGGGLFYLNSVDRVDMLVADLNKKIHYGEIWKFSRKCEIFSCFEDAFQCQSIHQSGENTNCGEKKEKLFCENCKLFRTIQVTAQIGQHQRKVKSIKKSLCNIFFSPGTLLESNECNEDRKDVINVSSEYLCRSGWATLLICDNHCCIE